MARSEARVHTRLWADRDFLALPGEAQRLYLLLLSQPDLDHAGVLPLTVRRWSGYTPDSTTQTLRRALADLVAARLVVVDEDTEELLIRSHLRNDQVLRMPNVALAAVRAYRAITSPLLRAAWLVEFHRYIAEDSSVILTDGKKAAALAASQALLEIYQTETLPEGFPEGLYGLGEGFWEGFPEPFLEPFTRGSPNPSGKASPEGSGNGSPYPLARNARGPYSLKEFLPPTPGPRQSRIRAGQTGQHGHRSGSAVPTAVRRGTLKPRGATARRHRALSSMRPRRLVRHLDQPADQHQRDFAGALPPTPTPTPGPHRFAPTEPAGDACADCPLPASNRIHAVNGGAHL